MWRAVFIDHSKPEQLRITLTRAPPYDSMAEIRSTIAELRRREAAESRAAFDRIRPFLTPTEALRVERDIGFLRSVPVRAAATQTAADPLEHRRCTSCIKHKLVWCHHAPNVMPLQRPHLSARTIINCHAGGAVTITETPTSSKPTPPNDDPQAKGKVAGAVGATPNTNTWKAAQFVPPKPEGGKPPQSVLYQRDLRCCAFTHQNPLCLFHRVSRK
ncbi:hypothetical protein KPH14_012747 [Odynerus spinipes]|uniref:Uncharacterized protein n=1 Tax=Odynerus spinipes TaxID=1348599 RepID=A0AAD9RFW2_9HYME|nr:hypothetical protein KPH14_012747 [Odynerus spinipes]